tara:strand:- start:10350 stop:10790 length:441 start_codon:yes stop_codon:yes gene_type:complete
MKKESIDWAAKSSVVIPKATGVPCPKCNGSSSRIIGGWHDNVTKFRRRRCRGCGNNYKTEQLINSPDKERLVPLLSEEERTKVRRGNTGTIKLTIEEVAEIKYLLKHSTYTERDLAIQYSVERGCIKSIRYEQSWKDVPTPSEYPG